MDFTQAEIDLIVRNRKEKAFGEYKYLHLMEYVLENGVLGSNRTGTDTLTIPHATISFDMADGIPYLTTKRIAVKTLKVELEGFIKGITTKSWYQYRGCRIWDDWCNPERVPYGTDSETQAKMAKEDDLGPIYGFQWRSFNAAYDTSRGYYQKGYDQLQFIIRELKTNPDSRRMLCSAWNPNQQSAMALPPCHFSWMVSVTDGKLNLSWNQRSSDLFLGIPFNIASYATLLHLLAKECGLEEGTLTGHLNNVHLYVNHLEQVTEQLTRTPTRFPTMETTDDNFDVLLWEHSDSRLVDYHPQASIKAPVAV
jgi:thymidylate synthase